MSADPISHNWDPLDEDMRQRLSARRFMSMTLERSLKLPATSEETEMLLHSSEPPTVLNDKLEIGNLRYSKAIDYAQGRDSKSPAHSDVSNVFKAGTPGVMSRAEVEDRVNLGQWRFSVGNQIVRLEVNQYQRIFDLLTITDLGSCALG